MSNKSNAAKRRLAAVGLMLLLAGCQNPEKHSLTRRLWNSGDWRKFSEPAPNPNLALFDAARRADVLVQYDAFSERHSTIKRNAYYLEANEALIAAGKKPNFVPLAEAAGMNPIPVLSPQAAATNPPPDLTAYAVTAREGRGFILHRQTQSKTTFDLPVYPETSGTPARIVLTPFAVAGDTVMIGAMAAGLGFLLWVQSGAPTH